MKTAILLGAGSSIPAGFPSTQDLTALILSGSGVVRNTDSTYSLNGKEPMGKTSRIVISVVRRVYAEAERYFAMWNERSANYEDIFYLIEQALDEELGEVENPAIRVFVEELRTDLEPRIKILNSSAETLIPPYEPGLPSDFKYLLIEARNYISDLVWNKLCSQSEMADHLNLFVEACKSGQITSISTLCHDTHLEVQLSRQGILLSDGFSDAVEGVRYWNGELASNGKIPFLKLHGSINWFRLRPGKSESFFDDRIGISSNFDHNHTRGIDGKFQTSLDGRPLLLIGTFNKILDYSRGFFSRASLSIPISASKC